MTDFLNLFAPEEPDPPPPPPEPEPEPDAGELARARAALERQRVTRATLRIPRQAAADTSTGLRIT